MFPLFVCGVVIMYSHHNHEYACIAACLAGNNAFLLWLSVGTRPILCLACLACLACLVLPCPGRMNSLTVDCRREREKPVVYLAFTQYKDFVSFSKTARPQNIIPHGFAVKLYLAVLLIVHATSSIGE